MPPRLPLESSVDCSTSMARVAVPWIAPPMVGEFPSPSAEPATCVPWPWGSFALGGLGRPSAYSLATRPVNAGVHVGGRAPVEAGVGHGDHLAVALVLGSVHHDLG